MVEIIKMIMMITVVNKGEGKVGDRAATAEGCREAPVVMVGGLVEASVLRVCWG